VNKSSIIDDLVKAGKIDVSEIEGKWEAFVSSLVDSPIEGCKKALVIAGSDPRGSIYGIYDVSEQIGVSPWYFFADVPTKQHKDIYVLSGTKVQPSPSIKYRGIFLNDEQPGLTNWVA
jgi:glycosyl hydrolase family 115 (putative glucuronidase)